MEKKYHANYYANQQLHVVPKQGKKKHKLHIDCQCGTTVEVHSGSLLVKHFHPKDILMVPIVLEWVNVGVKLPLPKVKGAKKKL